MLCEAILNDPYTKDYIIESADPDYQSTFDISDMYINLAALDLIFYIQNTGLVESKNPNNYFLHSYENDHLELVYDLLASAKVIEDDKIGSPKKDYLRSRLLSHKKKLESNRFLDIELAEDLQELNIKKGELLSTLIEKIFTDTLEN